MLPDLLRPGLEVVFCGTAAGSASARAMAYYAGPGNAFWRTLFATGLTSRQLAPSEYERLLGFGIGLTDLCKIRHGSDAEVATEEFDVDGLRARVAAVEPAYLAFNGKNAAQGALERQVELGLQPEQIGGATVWVLPSTSARARRYWDIDPWQELARICTGTESST
jgi:TDG/mug DNA glycosylase family protein